ncbi:MAG: hypothetical protein OXI32_07480 [bacterium]|nr:hypothetical protein [bacterium]
MTFIEDLLETDLATASSRASDGIPDVVAALDQLVPRIQSSIDLTTVRRFDSYVDMAAQWLANLKAHRPEDLPPRFFLYEQLRKDTTALPWVIPSADGLGVMTVLVDNLRGLAAGLPQECVRPRDDIDEYFFSRFCKALAQVQREREYSEPLKRAMDTLSLSKSDVAQLMGVSRQAVDKWLLAGPPADRASKLGAIAELADILRYRLLPGLPAEVVRRPAEAYAGRTMLELIANDEHDWLLQATKDSFDFSRVA